MFDVFADLFVDFIFLPFSTDFIIVSHIFMNLFQVHIKDMQSPPTKLLQTQTINITNTSIFKPAFLSRVKKTKLHPILNQQFKVQYLDQR